MNFPSGLIIVGAGGHGREVACVAISTGIGFAGFVDDCQPDEHLLVPFGVPYLGKVRDWGGSAGIRIVVGIGSGATREAVMLRMAANGIGGGLVDPMASIGVDVRIAPGVVVFAGATVTTNIDIGRHTHIGRGAAVGHDCVLGNYVTVMPLASVSGNVTIGDRATIGTGAVVRQGVSIGPDSFVGAGSVVLSDVPAGAVVVGNPARAIAERA
ncbi:NeuD/PglB/VioB family sugar acetyltransferase [Dietzia kunjamensis]|uniref:NeuD/PglB/VioB family sugar acetyltransferase n=1 Tax=Dietzia kunjamensis TaxID=322509 RepID=UPI003B96899F